MRRALSAPRLLCCCFDPVTDILTPVIVHPVVRWVRFRKQDFSSVSFNVEIGERITALGARPSVYILHVVDIYPQHSLTLKVAFLNFVANVRAIRRFSADENHRHGTPLHLFINPLLHCWDIFLLHFLPGSRIPKPSILPVLSDPAIPNLSSAPYVARMMKAKENSSCHVPLPLS